MVKRTVLVPPDGGYGWAIVFAGGLNNFIMIPLMQTFGLVFKDIFPKMGLTATQGSLILNVNAAFGMLAGFLNGPLLNSYGCRKVAIVGSLIASGGIICTSMANSFWSLMIIYGLIASFGLRIAQSAFNLSVNMYFRERKTKAIGIMISLTGFGPIFMPQITNLLMKSQAPEGVILIMGGICLNCLVAAFLLQPVEWHMKEVEEDVEEEEESHIINKRNHNTVLENLEEVDEDVENVEIQIETNNSNNNNNIALNNLEEVDEDTDNLDVKRQPLLRQNSKISQRGMSKMALNQSTYTLDYDQESTAMFGYENSMGGSVMSLNTIGRRQSVNAAEKSSNNDDITEDKPSRLKRIMTYISTIFDFQLFKDAIYVNIMLGMSFALFSEMNFANLTAFILTDYDMDTTQIATFMSVFGIADVIFRFIAPYVGEYLKQKPRKMFLYSLFASFAFRAAFMEASYYYLLGIAVCLGITRGFRSVYLNLIIPYHVPIERLASASGIQLMVNGLVIIVGGPICGILRDKTGNYEWVLIFMNVLTLATIIMWSSEFLYKRFRGKTS